MDDLISRRAAIAAAERESTQDGAYGYMDTRSIIDMLNGLPTIDPVKHGKWEMEPGYMYCSVCAWPYPDEPGLAEEYRYCPNCGAKMEE